MLRSSCWQLTHQLTTISLPWQPSIKMKLERLSCAGVFQLQLTSNTSKFSLFTSLLQIWPMYFKLLQILRHFCASCSECSYIKSSSSYPVFIFRYKHKTKITKIAIQSEGCQRSLTAHRLTAQVKKINCPQIILSYNKGANRKQQHCASAIGHEQYHHFIYNNYNSLNTTARWPMGYIC